MHTHSRGKFGRIGHLLVDACIVIVALAHIGPLAGTIDGTAATPVEAVASQRVETVRAARTCFPAASWDANDSERPCARIVRVEEDGSVRVVVTDADGTFRYVAGIGAKDR